MPASTEYPTPRRHRRDNHEGSVYELTSGPRRGEWRAQLSLPNGRRRTFSARTEDEVKQKLLDARWQASHGQLVPARGDTLRDYALDWLGLRRYEISPRTQTVYASVLEHHVFPVLGKLPLVDIDRRSVKLLHNSMLDKGLKPKTVHLAHGVLSAILNQAEADRLIPVNPAAKVHPPKVGPSAFVPLDPEEIQQLLVAMRGDPLEALFLLAVACGLRRGEACGIRWTDLDLKRGTLRLAGQVIRRPGGKFDFATTKTGTGQGLVIGLPQPVLQALLAHRDRQELRKRQAHELWKDQGYVFTNAVGAPIDPMQAYRMFKLLLKRAGLRDQRFHDLRHATASLLLAWGLDLGQVSKLLRHSSVAITNDVYGHLYQQTSQEIADKWGAFIEQAR